MAPQSVDDDYLGCSAQMSPLLKSLFRKESHGDFRTAWKKAVQETKTMQPQLDGLSMSHAIAIRVYSYQQPNIYGPFNNAVRSARNVYKSTFQYHVLHFLLSDAIQRINLKKTCKHTYRGTNIVFNLNSKMVRFGSFTSTSENPKVATDFGKKSCFDVITCHGASLSKYSAFPGESEILVPPYEQFEIVRVLNIKQHKNMMKLMCDVVYQLKSAGTSSQLRCSLLKGKNI